MCIPGTLGGGVKFTPSIAYGLRLRRDGIPKENRGPLIQRRQNIRYQPQFYYLVHSVDEETKGQRICVI